MMLKLQRSEVLVYREKPRSQATVRRHYEAWRRESGLPERCDEPGCEYHSRPLLWNGKPLRLNLDHRNGVNSDNRPENLRLLCPNCDAQQSVTRGGANKGRVAKSRGGFNVKRENGKRDYTTPAESGDFNLKGHPVDIILSKRRK